jgi:phenylalanyl-tRNA synthetase beta chain
VKLLLSWLREHVEFSVEPARLAEDLTEVGLAVDAVERVGSDWLFDIDVTTNRVDCMNVRGIAREVAVLYGVPLRALPTSLEETGTAAGEALRIAIEAPDLCPRFCARVLDVRMSPSPAWIRDRLEAVGVRPISNVVDLTNYVMLELGQPSHAFDLARIPGAELRIRWARAGEKLTTLDGIERTLTPRHGVVAGPEQALALAGIMGGASSEVNGDTRVVALEAAAWDPLSVRRAARSLGMHTEASHRFERGADPEGPAAATARIGHLLRKIGAGSVRPGFIDVQPAPRPRRTAALRPARLRLVLGAEVPEAKAHAILTGLGFGVRSAREPIEIPSWRADVTREIDLIEEVGRHFGVKRVPSTLPPAARPGGLRPSQLQERRLRDALVGAGLTEAVSYSFVAGEPSSGDAVRLANPLAEDQGALRSSIVLPGLIGGLRANLSHGRRDVGLFEIGRVFQARPGMPREERRLGLLLAGAARPRHWSEKPRGVDFFDARGVLELAADALGWTGITFSADAALPSYLHPGRAAMILRGSEVLGFVGALHPEFAAAHELRDETSVAEVSLETLLEATSAVVRFQAIPRFPGTSRDLSILLDRNVRSSDLLAWIRAAGGALLKGIEIADRYQGKQVAEGKLSLMATLSYQDPERTLTGEQVQASLDGIVTELRKRGAEIRRE